MAQYGEVRVDYITYTTGTFPAEANATVTVSSLVNNPVFSGDVIVDNNVTIGGNLTVSGSINGSGLLISGVTGLFESGSAADPSISFIGDEDTGFFNYEPNGVGITTSGVQHFALNTDGYLGLGTNTPTNARLEVSRLGGNYSGAAVPAGTAIFTFNGSNNTTSPNYITVVGGTEARAGIVFQTTGETNTAYVRHEAESGNLEFGTDQTTRTVINNNGKLLHNEIPNFSGIAVGGTATPHVQWGGTGNSGRSAFINWTTPYFLMLARATSGVGDYSAVQQNNELGRIVGVGANGLDFNSQSCEVRFRAADDFTSGNTPGRIELRTAPSGSTATQRSVIITSSGTLGVGDMDETLGLLQISKQGVAGQASLHITRSPNINNTSDIALSANSCIGGQNSINYVVSESGAYHRFYVNGSGNTLGVSGATRIFNINEDGAQITNPGNGFHYDVITTQDLGAKATQIPLNRDLGSMAYQDNNPYVTALRFPTAANALVYEEGTFDEKVYFEKYERPTGTEVPVTFTLRSTNYVRIGNQVTCNLRVQITPDSGAPYVNVGDRIQWSISGLGGLPYLPEGFTNQNVFNSTWSVSRRSNSTDGWLAGIGVAGGFNAGVLYYNPITITSTAPAQDYAINGGSWIFNMTYLLSPLTN